MSDRQSQSPVPKLPPDESEWAQTDPAEPDDLSAFTFTVHSDHDSLIASHAKHVGIRTADATMEAIRADTAAIRAAQKAKPGGRNSRLASKAEAMDYLGGISRQTFDRSIKDRVATVRVSGRDFYEYEDLDQWAAENKVGPSNATSEPATGQSVSVTQASATNDPRVQATAEKLKAARRGYSKRSRKDGT